MAVGGGRVKAFEAVLDVGHVSDFLGLPYDWWSHYIKHIPHIINAAITLPALSTQINVGSEYLTDFISNIVENYKVADAL